MKKDDFAVREKYSVGYADYDVLQMEYSKDENPMLIKEKLTSQLQDEKFYRD